MTIVLENANETVLDSIKKLVKNFSDVKYTVEPSFATLQKDKEAREMEWEKLGLNDLEDLEIAHIIKKRVLDKKEIHLVSEEEMEEYFSKKGVFV